MANMNGSCSSDQKQCSYFKRSIDNFLTKLTMSPTKENFTVPNSDIFWTAISIFFRIISIGANIYLAYDYGRKEKMNYLYWTLSCVLIPMLVTTSIQVAMYFQDQKASSHTKPPSFSEVLCCVIVLPFLFRYCQSLTYAIQSKRAELRGNKVEQKKYYEFMIQEEADVALIRIFECFMEAAPQKILQISIILAGEDNMSFPQFVSIVGSVISMSWCITSYHRCNRLSQTDKNNISMWGTIIQCLLHLAITVSRVLSIAIVASLFPKWTLIGCSVHAIVMTMWIFIFDPSPFCCNTMFLRFAFSAALGTVFIFIYVTPKDGPTRTRFSVFYTLCFIENVVCTILYILYTDADEREDTYFIVLCVMALAPYLCGIVLMILYYTRFHPNITSRHELVVDQSQCGEAVIPT